MKSERIKNMQVYLVGGAVRDMLMGHEPKDRDYVVINSSEQEMLDKGFSRVGSHFPVFLHPETDEEYALARREKKTGVGYIGFETETDGVTLEEDLSRRDLTINSIAFNGSGRAYDDVEHGHFFDPFGGVDDIQNKILRHTSDAFKEDPVRVLRIARFRARFGADWTVADETKKMVRAMGKKGVLSELNADRIWKEMSRAMMEPNPRLLFDTLLEMDALHKIFPEVYKLQTAIETRIWHPEGNTYEHTMLVLTQAAKFGFDLETRVACLVHDFGKVLTPFSEMPSHHGHDVKGVALARAFCERLSVPAKMTDRACHATRWHMMMHKLHEIKGKTFVKMFVDMSAWNDPVMVDVLVRVGMCDERGRLGFEDTDVSDKQVLVKAWDAARSVTFADVFPDGCTNVNKIKEGMLKARVKAVDAIL